MIESPAEGEGKDTKANAKFKPIVYDPPIQAWEVSQWDDAPSPVLICKETEQQYAFQRPRQSYYDSKKFTVSRVTRCMKSSTLFFFTWEEAKAYIIARAQRKLENLENSVDVARSRLTTYKALKLETFPDLPVPSQTKAAAQPTSPEVEAQ